MKLNIGIIGFGNMGKALALALKAKQGNRLFIYDKDPKKTKSVKGLCICGSVKELARKSNIAVLAVKPQDIEKLFKDSKNSLSGMRLFISIAAGVSTSLLQGYLGKIPVIRAMPNLAAKVQESATFICKGKFAGKKDLKTAEKMFSAVGEVTVTKENLLDKITALSGSGPGYVFYFMDSIYKSALKIGFSAKDARKAITQVFWGAAKLAKASKEDFESLVKGVASKGGTTEAALKVFEKKKLKTVVEAGLKAACSKASKIV